MTQTKTSRIELRTDIESKKLIEKAARLKGQTISAYILSQSIAAAQKEIEHLETITLADEGRDLFYSLITNPPAPNKALKKLFETVG